MWRKAVAFAPVLLLLVYLPGQLMLRCRMDGLLRPSCCCSYPNDAQKSGPALKAQDCCDREMTGSERPLADAARRTAPEASGAIAAVLPVSTPFFDLAGRNRSLRPWQAQGPPRGGPALVLLKHAFLI